MPVYNCEKYIDKAIKSVLSQTFSDFELIIVDDGSSDTTFNICKALVCDRDDVHLYTIPHGGVSKARNFGLNIASHDYILFMDCDDTWEKDLLETISNSIDKKCDLLLFGIQHDYYLSDDSFQYSKENLGNSGQIKEVVVGSDIDRLLSTYNISSPCNKVYKRKIIAKNALRFCENCVYLEDLKFNFDYLCFSSAIKVLHRDLYHYRLFTDKKQLLKRNFGKHFINADELYVSAIAFVDAKRAKFKDCNVLVSVLLIAYINELLARTESANAKESKMLLRELNKNKNFCRLLKAANGKTYKLINILRMISATNLQFKLIKKQRKI